MSKVALTSRMPGSVQKSSRIPVVTSTKKSKAHPAPGPSKLHKKWRDQFETGEASSKKPEPPDCGGRRPDWEFQQAVSKTCGVDVPDHISKCKSYGMGNHRQILGELSCDPEKEHINRQSNPCVMKPVCQNVDTSKKDDDFEVNEASLQSILSNKGIQPLRTPCKHRQTFTAQSATKRFSIYNHPRSSNLFDSVIPAMSKENVDHNKQEKDDDFEVNEASLQSILSNKGIQPLRTPCKHRQTFTAQSATKRCSIYNHPRSSNVFDSVIPAMLKGKVTKACDGTSVTTSEIDKAQGTVTGERQADKMVDKLAHVMLKTPEKMFESAINTEKDSPCHSDANLRLQQKTQLRSDCTTPLSATRRVKTKENLEMTPVTPSRVLSTNKNPKPSRQMTTPSPGRFLSNIDRLRPTSTKKSLWDSPFGQVVQVKRTDSIFPEYKRLETFDVEPECEKEEANKGLSECYMPRRILKKESKTENSSTSNPCQYSSEKRSHVQWADEPNHDVDTVRRHQLFFTAIDETGEQDGSKENICPITKKLSAPNHTAADLSTNHLQPEVKLTNQSKTTTRTNSKARDNTQRKEIAPNVSHGSCTYVGAMYTESESDAEGQRSDRSCPSNTQLERPLFQESKSSLSDESVHEFVGVESNRKRQNITELNERISESNNYVHKLLDEASNLQHDQERDLEGNNVLYQLELIRRQTQELIQLQKQLQDQVKEKLSADQHVCNDGLTRDQDFDQSEKVQVSLTNSNTEELNNNEILSPLVDQHTQKTGFLTNSNFCSESELTPKIQKSPIWKEKLSVVASVFLPVSLPSPPTTFSQTVTTQSQSSNKLCNVGEELCTSTVKGREILSVFEKPDNDSGKLSSIPIDDWTVAIPKPTKPDVILSPCDAYEPKDIVPISSPVWTPVALKSTAEFCKENNANSNSLNEFLKVSDEPLDLSAKTRSCSKEVSFDVFDPMHMYNTAYRSAGTGSINRNINVKTVRSMTPNKTFTTQSAFKSLDTGSSIHLSAFSRIKSSPHKDVGSLSLVANFSPAFKRVTDDTIRRNVLIHTNDQYQEALLDNECELYLCRLQRRSPCDGRGFMNPIARVLAEGDEMHFIPIREEKPQGFVHRDSSAFCCYSP